MLCGIGHGIDAVEVAQGERPDTSYREVLKPDFETTIAGV